MEIDAARAAFATADDIECAVAVDVGKDRIFRAFHAANRYVRPRFAHTLHTRVQTHANLAAFLPASGNIRQTIAVHIG